MMAVAETRDRVQMKNNWTSDLYALLTNSDEPCSKNCEIKSHIFFVVMNVFFGLLLFWEL